MKVLITGGAGFVGSNLAHYLAAKKGCRVTVLDNLSRRGVKKNWAWLKDQHASRMTFLVRDICCEKDMRAAVIGMDVVYHLAAQVAVTTSVIAPRPDFEINALGTFNVLEAVRQSKKKPIVLLTSTNKVYGGLEDVKVRKKKTRYEFRHLPRGISERHHLDFHSPYGCSKGAADQYVRDYGRIYDLETIVFRMSCVYGYRQFGNEDQGWVAHFMIAALLNRALTIYGDGRQIRDILFIDDLVRAMHTAVQKIKISSGKVYNIGGGQNNTLSLLELVERIQFYLGRKIDLAFEDWRPGDQPVYVSDIAKIGKDLGWTPKININSGIQKLWEWISAHRHLFKK